MKQEFRNKKFGFKRFLNSFKYSCQGLKYAYLNEQSMFIHAICTILAVCLGIILKINCYEWIIIIALLSLIAIIELLNTAIEAAVDIQTKEYNELAKIAKDCGSAAVFLASMIATIIGLIIFIPKIIELL